MKDVNILPLVRSLEFDTETDVRYSRKKLHIFFHPAQLAETPVVHFCVC
jgi:hypothetical protein